MPLNKPTVKERPAANCPTQLQYLLEMSFFLDDLCKLDCICATEASLA